MEFNASGAVFAKKNNFADSMRQFISEEAAIFSPEKEEAASASMDRTAEKIVRFSADKSKVKAKEQKRILDSIKGDNIKSETGPRKYLHQKDRQRKLSLKRRRRLQQRQR